MSTVGHFITMLGVMAFYTAIFEAHLEKKITYYLFSLIPRLNKRICYYILKNIVLQEAVKISNNIPGKPARVVLL
jgi:hypothetical protein